MCDFARNCKKHIENTCTNENLCPRHNRLTEFFKKSNLPPVALDENWLTPDDCDKEAFDSLQWYKVNIVDFVNKGKNLYICSSGCGLGKTTWTYKIAMTYLNEVWNRLPVSAKPVYFTSVSDLLSIKKTSFINDDTSETDTVQKMIEEADLVIWDDFGVRSLSDFDRDYILDLIDYRISHKKSNIYTSNNLFGTSQTLYGERIKSRVIGLSDVIVLNGSDKRGIEDGDNPMSGIE